MTLILGFLKSWWKEIAIAIAVLIIWGWIHGLYAGRAKAEAERDKVKGEFAAFVSNVKKQGEDAADKAKQIEADNLKRKENADAEHAQTVANLSSTISRLRRDADAARASSRAVPAAPASSGRPDLACFDRAELGGALGSLDKRLLEGSRRLADEGSACAVDLNTAKAWAQGR